MQTGIRILTVAYLIAVALPATAEEIIYLWMDDENVYNCYEPWIEEGISIQIVETTVEDCDGGGSCDWGWSEGVIYLWAARVEFDLTSVSGLSQVEAEIWEPDLGDARAFLYHGETLVAMDTNEDGGNLILSTGGQAVDRLAISTCGGELYEVYLTVEDVSPAPAAAVGVALGGNHPNPFNPKTTIHFELPSEAPVNLAVYDLHGRCVAQLHEGTLAAGAHAVAWNGHDDSSQAMASGVYIYRLQAGDTIRTGSMVLTK